MAPKSVWAITFEPPHPKNRPDMHQKAAKSSFPTHIGAVDGVAGLGLGPWVSGWAPQQFWSEIFPKKFQNFRKFSDFFGEKKLDQNCCPAQPVMEGPTPSPATPSTVQIRVGKLLLAAF